MRRFHTIALGLLVASLLTSPAVAEKQAPPAPGAPRDFALPPPQRLTLPNGLEVTLVVTPGITPQAAIALAVNTGVFAEAADEVWLSRLTGEMLSQGTKTRSAKQIAEEAAAMGSVLQVSMDDDESVILMDVLSDKVEPALALVADVVANPAFPPAEVDRLKGDLKRELAVAMSQPGTLATFRSMTHLFPNHAYGRTLPTAESIDAFTVDKVRAFYARGVGPAGARLFVIGSFDAARAEAAIREAFGGWTGAAVVARPPAPSMKATGTIEVIDRPGAVQSVIQLSTRTLPPTHPDRLALLVTNTILGGSFTSRITRNLREKHGYAYSPYSFFVSLVNDAYWQFRGDVKTDVTGPSLKELYRELDAITTTPPPAGELKDAQAFVNGVFAIGVSSRFGLLRQLRQMALYGLPDDYLATYMQRVLAVTAADVLRVAKAQLQRKKMIVIVEGDTKVIDKQLKAIGPIVRWSFVR